MSAARKGRRTKTAATARLRPFWLLILALIGLLGTGAYVALTLPVFHPNLIQVRGTRVVSEQDVVERAAIDMRANMWLQDSAAIERRIERIPYVDTVRIDRAWPGVETFVVTERAPYAIVPSSAGNVLVDRELSVLEVGIDTVKLPELRATIAGPVEPGAFLTQTGIEALRDDNDDLVTAQIFARSLVHDKYGDLVVVLRDGVRVLFGDERDLAKKIPLVNPILTQVGRAGRPIAAIDLRAESTPVVVYKK